MDNNDICCYRWHQFFIWVNVIYLKIVYPTISQPVPGLILLQISTSVSMFIFIFELLMACVVVITMTSTVQFDLSIFDKNRKGYQYYLLMFLFTLLHVSRERFLSSSRNSMRKERLLHNANYHFKKFVSNDSDIIVCCFTKYAVAIIQASIREALIQASLKFSTCKHCGHVGGTVLLSILYNSIQSQPFQVTNSVFCSAKSPRLKILISPKNL